jgi:hypothetical protein
VSYSKRKRKSRHCRLIKSHKVRLGFRLRKMVLKQSITFHYLWELGDLSGLKIKEILNKELFKASSNKADEEYFSFTFHDEDGCPQLKNSYCVFLDVLGFKDRLQESYKNGKKDALFRSFLSAVKTEFHKIREKESHSLGVVFRAFSDNILFGQPLIQKRGRYPFIINVMWKT